MNKLGQNKMDPPPPPLLGKLPSFAVYLYFDNFPQAADIADIADIADYQAIAELEKK